MYLCVTRAIQSTRTAQRGVCRVKRSERGEGEARENLPPFVEVEVEIIPVVPQGKEE